MTTKKWYQVEFYSRLDKRWVPLFGQETNVMEARRLMETLKFPNERRLVKITQTIEVVDGGDEGNETAS